MWFAKLQERVHEPILAQYGDTFENLNWVPVAGGFSGARVWRGDDPDGIPRYALKHWPFEVKIERLSQIHEWMSDASHLPFVPQVLSTVDGDKSTRHGGRLWDATNWLQGQSRLPANRKEVESACETVAKLHMAWVRYAETSISPGVQRRLDVLTHWLVKPSVSFAPLQSDMLTLIGEGVKVVNQNAAAALEALLPWAEVTQKIQPCIRDLRGEHVLFEGQRVTAIVDYGAMGRDSPAFDLARLLGDLVGEDQELFALGLKKYRECQRALDFSDRFVRLLDRVGVVCSILGWFARLSTEIDALSLDFIANRMRHLIVRAEQFKSF